MDKVIPKTKPFYPSELKTRYKVRQDLTKQTLKYILDKNHIKFISENEQEVKIPKNCQLAYISPKGKLILINNEGKNHTHDELASIIKPRSDKDSRKSMTELLLKGFIVFADISSEEEKLACICYVKETTTKAQHDRLDTMKRQYHYTFMKDENDKNDLIEQLTTSENSMTH